MRPSRTRDRLTVCWTARPVFSAAVRSDQGRRPSSFRGVTVRLLEDEELVEERRRGKAGKSAGRCKQVVSRGLVVVSAIGRSREGASWGFMAAAVAY